MSLYDYEQSRLIHAGLPAGEPSFAALIMAALRRADTANAAALRAAFPGICGELQRRHDAPGGRIPGDPDHEEYQERRRRVLEAGA